MWDTITVFGVGILLGSALTWSAIRYGIGIATRLHYQIKEDLPPSAQLAVPFDQASTGSEEDVLEEIV